MWLERTIQLRGIVEGVGMRPALFRHSVRFGLTGQVLNREDEVELVWEGSCEAVEAAFAALPEAFPPGSRVDLPIVFADREIDAPQYRTFAIVRIASPGAVNLLAAPDRAPCPRCRAEVRDAAVADRVGRGVGRKAAGIAADAAFPVPTPRFDPEMVREVRGEPGGGNERHS